MNPLLCVVVLVLALLRAAPVSAGEWHYTIGKIHTGQQASFCLNEQAALEIAEVFTRFGPRTGYSALAGARDCTRLVRNFTPLEVIQTVAVAENEQNAYTVSMVRARTDRGEELILITTRRVAQP